MIRLDRRVDPLRATFRLDGVSLRGADGPVRRAHGQDRLRQDDPPGGRRRPAAGRGRPRASRRAATSPGLPPGERGIGYVPQDAALFRTMTVYNHLAFALNSAPE